MREFDGCTAAQLVDSTVAARLDGFVGGRGTPARLREELPRLGLSAEAARHLERLVEHRDRRV